MARRAAIDVNPRWGWNGRGERLLVFVPVSVARACYKENISVELKL